MECLLTVEIIFTANLPDELEKAYDIGVMTDKQDVEFEEFLQDEIKKFALVFNEAEIIVEETSTDIVPCKPYLVNRLERGLEHKEEHKFND